MKLVQSNEYLVTTLYTNARWLIKYKYDRLISKMGFPILVRRHLYIELGPRSLSIRLSVATVLRAYPCTSSCLWVIPPDCTSEWTHRYHKVKTLFQSNNDIMLVYYYIAEITSHAGSILYILQMTWLNQIINIWQFRLLQKWNSYTHCHHYLYKVIYHSGEMTKWDKFDEDILVWCPTSVLFWCICRSSTYIYIHIDLLDESHLIIQTMFRIAQSLHHYPYPHHGSSLYL